MQIQMIFDQGINLDVLKYGDYLNIKKNLTFSSKFHLYFYLEKFLIQFYKYL